MVFSIDFGVLISALVAIFIAAFEYHQLKEKRRSELFSELNRRYLDDDNNIQPVIRYLSHLYKDVPQPEGYQIEIFLRFFEELDVYLKKEVLDEDLTYHLFAYYCLEIFKPKWNSFLVEIEYHKEEWPLLEDFIKRMKVYEQKNRSYGTNKM